MFSKLIGHEIDFTRQKYQLTPEYRGSNQSSCIYKFVPGQGDRRFLSNSSMIEQIIEVVVEANRASLTPKEIEDITYYLIVKNVATSVQWDKSMGTIVAQYLACVVMKPDYFQIKGKALYREDLPIIPDNRKKIFEKVCAHLYEATQLSLTPTNWITPEAIKALDFVFFIGESSENISYFMQRLSFFSDILRQFLSAFELAAYVHHEVIRIHPYVDGNGRVARALMNLILISAGYSPVNIKHTSVLESEYDHVVSEMDCRVFSKWLRQVYFTQTTGILFIESCVEHLDILNPAICFPFKPVSSIFYQAEPANCLKFISGI